MTGVVRLLFRERAADDVFDNPINAQQRAALMADPRHLMFGFDQTDLKM
jgi:hypothetical protein